MTSSIWEFIYDYLLLLLGLCRWKRRGGIEGEAKEANMDVDKDYWDTKDEEVESKSERDIEDREIELSVIR